MKVVLAGIYGLENHGEKFIFHTVDYLVKSIDKEIVTDYLDFEICRKSNVYFVFRLCRKLISFIGNSNLRYRMYYGICKWLYKPLCEVKISNSDALIFAAGSFKYGTQDLWAMYSIAVEVAQKHSVPVMFDAMNIQDFDTEDWRCLCLKEHVNYSCVKMFTTRDGEYGVSKFNKYYRTNPKLIVEAVGDPAFWLKDCYGVLEIEKKGLVGINLIDGNQFLSYGGRVAEKELLQVYLDLIAELDKVGRKWQLFTNGLLDDYAFGEKICAKLGVPVSIYTTDDTKEFAKFIAGCKSVLGARLHTCICAYSYDVPFAGFIWDEKMLRFGEVSKTQQLFCNEDNLSGALLYEKLLCAEVCEFDKENRNQFKERTRKTINAFVEKCSTYTNKEIEEKPC